MHPASGRLATCMTYEMLHPLVIPGHRGAMGPESITTIVSMDSGLALRAPRNDDRRDFAIPTTVSKNRYQRNRPTLDPGALPWSLAGHAHREPPSTALVAHLVTGGRRDFHF